MLTVWFCWHSLDAADINHALCLPRRFSLPEQFTLSNLAGLGQSSEQGSSNSGIAREFQRNVDPSLSWDFIKWMRGFCSLPLLIKVRPNTARMPDPAVRCAAGHDSQAVAGEHFGCPLGDSMQLRQIISGWCLPQGILSAHDAVRALDAGVDGLVVSNHGGQAPAAHCARRLHRQD